MTTLQQTVDDSVRGMGYELVELERAGGGLLRVTIDHPWSPGDGPAPPIGLDDCERVTRQLQFVLEVENVDYRRLEVSSPGIDRPLRDERDFERFVGELIDITLREPIGADGASGQVAANRKKFRGELQKSEEGEWQLVWSDEPPPQPGRRSKARREPAPLNALTFELDDLQSARLAPVVDFKGRRRRPEAPAAGNGVTEVEGSLDGPHEMG